MPSMRECRMAFIETLIALMPDIEKDAVTDKVTNNKLNGYGTINFEDCEMARGAVSLLTAHPQKFRGANV